MNMQLALAAHRLKPRAQSSQGVFIHIHGVNDSRDLNEFRGISAGARSKFKNGVEIKILNERPNNFGPTFGHPCLCFAEVLLPHAIHRAKTFVVPLGKEWHSNAFEYEVRDTFCFLNNAGHFWTRALPAHRTLKRTCPNCTGLPFSATTSAMTPPISALISFITFIASIMQTTVSSVTVFPTSTKGGASGDAER